MKRIGLIAFTFVLTACLFTGCRRNNMQGETGTSSTPSSSTESTQPSSLPVPSVSGGDNSTPTDAMDGITGTEEALPRSPIPGMPR